MAEPLSRDFGLSRRNSRSLAGGALRRLALDWSLLNESIVSLFISRRRHRQDARQTLLRGVFTVLLVAVAVACPRIQGVRVQALTAAVYVSPDGSDLNPGTEAAPVQTLHAAQRIVRTVNAHMDGDIAVYLESGVYRLDAPLNLSPADSGTNGFNIDWTAAPGASPVIVGSRAITGWTMTDPSLDIWSAAVPVGFRARQMYVNGVRASLAAGPVPVALRATSTGYTASSDVMDSWRNPAGIEFVYEQQLGQMTEPICPIASIKGRKIRMAEPCWENSTRRVLRSVTSSFNANLVGDGTLGLPTYVENAYELLSEPGQFYIDAKLGRVYYKPRPGQDMTTANVEAPVLQVLVDGRGTVKTPLAHITFDGIEFAYSTWLQPSTTNGFSEVQAGYTLTGAGAYKRQGLCRLVHDGSCPYGAWSREPAAVQFTNDRDVSITDDQFVHLGGAGLSFDDGTMSAAVSASVFTDISGNGLEIGDVDLPTARGAQQTRNVVVTDDYIHAIGVEFPGAVGIFVGYAADCAITHNQLDDLPYTAISIGWGGWQDKLWHPPPVSFTRSDMISDNRIYDFLQTFSDGGGIYTLGMMGPSFVSGLHVSGNVVFGQEIGAGRSMPTTAPGTSRIPAMCSTTTVLMTLASRITTTPRGAPSQALHPSCP